MRKLPRQFHVWLHYSKDEKEARKSELDAALQRFHPDDYQVRLPEWMRRNASAGVTAQVPDADARYLEDVAWDSWSRVQELLSSTPAPDCK